MNEQGRHFRDQSCPENPTCDYESRNGIKCDFFEVEGDLATLPYPEDFPWAQLLLLLQQKILLT